MSRILGGPGPLKRALFEARKDFDDFGKELSYEESAEILSIAKKCGSIEALSSKSVQAKLNEIDWMNGYESGTARQYAYRYFIYHRAKARVEAEELMKQVAKENRAAHQKLEAQYSTNATPDMISFVIAIFIFGFIFILLFLA